MTIVDSSVWIDVLAGRATRQATWLHRQISQRRIGLTDLILYEVLQGARDDSQFMQLRSKLEPFELWPTMTPGAEVRAARNYRALRRLGITVRKSADCLIATYCIDGDHELLHNDRDFDGFEAHLGLRVIHPTIQ
jgi:predicted nucleic acid-binding protein